VHAVATFLALFALTMLVAMVLILSQAVSQTFDDLLVDAPDVVIRRVSTGGWMPLPVDPALAAARAVPGVLRPRPRIWGVADAGGTAVTIVGVAPTVGDRLPEGLHYPDRGEALVGPGIPLPMDGQPLLLAGQEAITVTVRARMPSAAAMAVHDLVLLHTDDARRLLGLQNGQASDLVLEVFHEEEIDPLVRDLSVAFPWPVQVTTRNAVQTAYASRFAAAGAMGLLSLVPAGLAFVLLILALGLGNVQQRPEMGLMKTMGWTSGDLLRLHFSKTLLVAFPALLSGLVTAMVVCFIPTGNGLTRLLFNWPGPPLQLSCQGLAAPLGLTFIMVLVPYLATAFWTGWHLVQADPMELIQEQR
jgi:hypothetical protein